MGLFGDVLSFGGSLLGFSNAKDTNAAREKQFKQSHALQSLLAHQGYSIAAGDMKNAGINPILAGRWGPASASPVSMSNFENPAVSASQVMANTSQATKNLEESDLAEARTNTEIQQQFKVIADTELTYDQADMVRSQIMEIAQNTKAKTFENYINEIRATLHANHNWLTLMQETGTQGGSIAQLAGAVVGSLSHVLRGLFDKITRGNKNVSTHKN
jgi:hypothetical protein